MSIEGKRYETRQESRLGSTAIPQGRLDTRALDSDGDGRPYAPLDLCGRTATGVPIQYCTAEGGGMFRPYDASSGSYNYQLDSYLVTPAQRASFFAAGERTLRGGVRGFFEASYVASETEQQLAA